MRTKFTLIAVPLLALGVSASLGGAEPAPAPRMFQREAKPNIIYIMADELGYCVLFNSEKEEWKHEVTRNLLVEPSGSQTHPVTLAGGR